jgi:hypothetical protein
MASFNYKKAVQCINYIIAKTGKPVDKLKIIKLLWAADRYHLRKYARLVTGDSYFALPNGPVGSHTLDLINRNIDRIGEVEKEYAQQFLTLPESNKVNSKLDPDTDFFSDSDIEALDFAITTFSSMTTASLKNLSHQYPEYKKFEKAIEDGVSERFPINLDDFFEDLSDSNTKNFFTQDKELLGLNKMVFEENKIFT